MFLRIFVPLDGSPLAEGALDMAALLARRVKIARPTFEPTIILFRAIDLALWLDVDVELARSRPAELAKAYLEEQAESLRQQGLAVETAVRVGNPVEEIVEQALARQADLILMTTHGRTGLARWALGSVAERVARAAAMPVLLIPSNAPAIQENAPEEAGLRFLVPLDGFFRSEAALQQAIALAQLCGAELRLLFVLIPRFDECEPPGGGREAGGRWDGGRRRVRQIERYLMRKVEEARKAGVRARWAFGYGLPGPKIIEEAQQHQASLIIMATHGHSEVSRRKLGGTVEEVIHRGKLPLLLVAGADSTATVFQTAPEEAEATPR
jgi:nucleotide-binding universal stress UspA family protein